jgi:Carboxypeptidase regulatory-like domain
LQVTAPGHAAVQRRFELTPVTGSIAGERREDLTLAVYDAVLRGVVDDARGQPVGGARLAVAHGPAQGRTVVTATDGSFSLEQLPPGSLRLTLEHAELPPYQTTVEPGVALRLSMPLGGGIDGRLLDDAGRPLFGVRVMAAGPGPSTVESATARDGSWRLPVLRSGAWQLTVTKPGFLPALRTVSVTAGRARGEITVRDVTLTLARGAIAAGTVRDRRGARLAGVRVSCRGAEGSVVETRSDLHGEFRLRDCPTGDLEVSAQHEGAHAATHVVLRPGQEVLSLVLELASP